MDTLLTAGLDCFTIRFMQNKKGFALYFFMCFTLFSVITPNLQLFLEARGWSYTMIGVLQGIYQLVGVTGPLFIGAAADKRGRYRPFLIGGYLALIPSFWLLGLLSHPLAAIAVMGIIGIALKSIVPLSDTLLSHSLKNPEEDYGKMRIWGSIGFLACSVFLDYSGVLKHNFQRSFLLLITVFTVLSLLTLFFLPSSRSRKESSSKQTESDEKIPRVFWAVMVVLFIAWFANSAYFSFFTLFLREIAGIEKVNIQWGLGALFEIPLMFLSGAILRKLGYKRLMVFTLLVTVFRMGLYWLVTDPVLLTMTQMLHGITFGLLHSLSVASINRFVPAGKKASAMALYSAVRGGSAFLGSALGGWISDTLGLQSLFGVYSLIPLLALAMLLMIPTEKLERRRPVETLDL